MTSDERSLLDDAAIVEQLPHALFLVTGERPLAYLQDILAQDVGDLGPERGAIAALLTPDGRVAAELRVLPGEDGVLIDAEENARGGIEDHVARHAGLAGCEVRDVTPERVVAAVRGPLTDRALDEAGLPAPGPGEAAVERSGNALLVRVLWGVPGVDVIGSRDDVAAILAKVDVPRAGIAQLEAARIAAGRPRFGPDVGASTLVNETPLLAHGVSLTKGCYPGQESVARVHNLGRVRRMLRGLRSTGSLAAGAEVRTDGAVVGTITSAAPAGGGGFAAIAFLRSEVPPGAVVEVEGSAATVEELV